MKTAGRFSVCVSMILPVGLAWLSLSCTRASGQPEAGASRPSDLEVEVRDGGPVVLTTSAAEFQILPSGAVRAFLLKDGKKLTLEQPGRAPASDGDSIVHDGQELRFTPDFGQAKVLEAMGKLGRGKRVEIPGHPLAPSGMGVEGTLEVEAYDDFPNVALVSVAYKNVGTSDFAIDSAVMQQHHFNAGLADTKAKPYEMWSFQGSSYDWGKDDVQKLTRTSAQPNAMGGIVKDGYGGGIPVVAFWTSSVGEAIGHIETLPLTLSLPVKVEKDGRVTASLTIPANTVLKPGETYSAPRSFVAVYSGD